ncbi:unnamed protein product [Medioppia subpectinata]|uniref:NADP-dependent oxidoreductase domain-containing protein n=1 Tax=Medioppia subpectinata TaxID=1979941 RepID=A0A7R9KC85_9ACAR|nr:unnamed protein product [Medioppia subpectinata]CAG2100815.1 unnamed protein product [Medioppia subpectinata]
MVCFLILPMNCKLNNSLEMPVIGLGTWQLTDKKVLTKAINTAIDSNYRHIDTAAIYNNEDTIGEILEDLFENNVVKREELFITSKLWNSDHEDVRNACETSLKKLKLDYLDLYLIHWPVSSIGEFNLKDVWTAMESLVIERKVKSIGVANFGIKNLTHLLSFCTIKPVVNQIEFHPYLPQREIRSFCSKHDILCNYYEA